MRENQEAALVDTNGWSGLPGHGGGSHSAGALGLSRQCRERISMESLPQKEEAPREAEQD